MKYSFALLLLYITANFASAQTQEYYLAPADVKGNIQINMPKNLKRVNDLKVKWNQLQPGIEGYRIQIYIGRSREEAIELRNKFLETYPDINADLVFENPYVKVRIGEYRNRIEAQKMYFELKKEYESVIVVSVKNMRYPKL